MKEMLQDRKDRDSQVHGQNNGTGMFDYFAKNTSRFGWPLGAYGLGLLSLSSLPQNFPWLFGVNLFWVLCNLLGMDYLYSKVQKQKEKGQEKTWLTWNQWLRVSTSLAGSSLMALVFFEEGLHSWAGVLTIGVWVGGLQALSSTSIASPRLGRMLVFLFSLMPLVLFTWKGDSQTILLMVVAGFYTLSFVPTINSRYQDFQDLANLRNKSATEKKEIERFIDLLPANVSWLDHDLKYLRVNQKTADFFGRSKSDFVGQTFGFTKFKERESHRALLLKFLESKDQTQNFVVPFLNQAQQVRRHQVWLEKFEVTDSHQPELVILTLDVEDHLRAEEALLEQRGQDVHSARLASLGEMASGIAHEIRNPLAIISGANVLIRNELKKGPEMRLERLFEKSEQIAKTVARILRIMEGMRKLSRGDQAGNDEWFSLTTLVEETISFCEEKLRTARVDIKIVLAQDNLEIYGNQAQLSQVLVNLISNARDVIEDLEDRRIRIRAEVSSHGDLLIHVGDSGAGVLDPQKLFTPFFTTKGAGQGTGLGLSISRKIVEAHEGHLTYQRVNGMTVFEILIPVARLRTAALANVA
ncbi:MAG: GHKL domain-containing protein [Bdellovibrionaceae bacterium]|nr:GHKL domain-containing protein [Pseudobdellovibrionaceae bacterium]